MIALAEPNLTGKELDYLQECIAINHVSSVGPFVSQFEEQFAAYVGSPHAVATANGTCAIHMALILAGVDPGDEVWVSDFTFAASGNPIFYQRAVPVLVDSERRTWNLESGLVVEELDRRARLGIKQPKAIIAVHILGCPADLKDMLEACRRHGVVLIEDAAEALGAKYTEGSLAGHQVGTLGDIGCFSFNGNKIITTGGGGMLVTRDAALARRGKHLTTQAKLPGYAYNHDAVGYNYRLTNLAAALGVAQLERLDEFIVAKRAIAARYRDALAGAGVEFPPTPSGMAPTHWLFSILLPGPWEPILESMEGAGVQTRPLWTPLHQMAPYKGAQLLGSGAVSSDIAARGLSLPCSTHLRPQDQAVASEALLKALALLPSARG